MDFSHNLYDLMNDNAKGKQTSFPSNDICYQSNCNKHKNEYDINDNTKGQVNWVIAMESSCALLCASARTQEYTISSFSPFTPECC